MHFGHSFQRILLDTAYGGPWRDHIAPPAWRNADDATLEEAILLGEAALAGGVDFARLDRNSLRWRGKLRGGD